MNWVRKKKLVHSTHTYLPMKMEQTECSETSVYKLQTPGNYPEENTQHSEHGESLKSRMKELTGTAEKKLLTSVAGCVLCEHTTNEISEICNLNLSSGNYR
jgi:hypothetical protein